MQSNFWAGSKNLDRHKFNLGPVKGQGIRYKYLSKKNMLNFFWFLVTFVASCNLITSLNDFTHIFFGSESGTSRDATSFVTRVGRIYERHQNVPNLV